MKVPLDTVDNNVDRQQLKRLDFIKIDVEGAEDLVLKGALKTLEVHRPTIIFERNNESVENVVTLLRSYGYKFLNLSEESLSNDMKKWPHDVLAVAKDKEK